MSDVGHSAEARSTNFLLTVGTSKQLRFAVQSSNITEVILNFTAYPSTGKDLRIPSDKVELQPLIVDFIVSEDYSEWIEIFKWMMTCKNTPPQRYEEYTRTCELIALDSQNQPVVSFIYDDCWPTSLEGITLAINDTDSNVVTSTATLQYNKFKIRLKDGTIYDEQYIDQQFNQ